MVIRLTLHEIIASIHRQCGVLVGEMKVRRTIDALEKSGRLEVMRIVNARTVSGDDVGIIIDELRRGGRIPEGAASC